MEEEEVQQEIEPGAVGGGEEEVAAGDVEVQDWTDKIYSHDEIIEMIDERLTKEERRGLKSVVRGKSTRGRKVFKYI